MKKFALGLLSFLLVVGSINAQEGKKALKKGSKILSNYAQNAVANADQLEEGIMLIEKAFESEEVKSEAKYYNMLGEAYNAVISGQINAKILDANFVLANADYAMKAMNTFKKAYDMAEKKGDKKDALNGLLATENHLNNVGIYMNEVSDYKAAFSYWNEAIKAYKMIEEMGGKSRLSEDAAVRNDHYYYTVATGNIGQVGAAMLPVLEEMDATGTDKGVVYEALYNIYQESDKTKAVSYLEKGRTLFPEDTGLLFAEINYYLSEGKLDILTDKLKSALEQEPDNITIYTTLGNVYDQLNASEREAGNVEKADEYFTNAMSYYTQALEKDPTNFDAVYSQGALYYNKAASMTASINELANDFSAAGTKKYDALKLEMDGYFDEALPYFNKAEGMNGSDLNTLIALKEIYARKNEMTKVTEYKGRIEAVQAAGK